MMIMMVMTMMLMTTTLMLVMMMTTIYLDGVPLIANPGVSFIGGKLWHHISVQESNL